VLPPGQRSAPEGVIVGTEFADDAAVVRLQGDDERCLVLTTDVIAPLVDDPEVFGEIAAVNAISDVYAMGGAPRFVLNLVFFCDEKLPLSVLHAVLRGGARACARAGAPVVGGHSVRDPEIKFGLAVTGEVLRGQVLSNRTARAGQLLVLTKALGTGVIGTAIKQGVASAEELAAAVASMTCLNDQALAAARNHGVSACTDVTGFGLLGHLRNILRGSSLAARLDMHALPALPGVLGHIEAGRVPGGSRASLEFIAPMLRVRGVEDRSRLLLAADAQTSGGLLLTVDVERAQGLCSELAARGQVAAVVGELLPPSEALPVGTTIVTYA
jgi:selenide,water dikinase